MADEEGTLVQLAEKVIQQVLEFGIQGAGPLPSAVESAEQHLKGAGGDQEAAIERLVATHLRLAAVSGFVTGLGGAVALPITMPASVAGMYIIATRMSAGIAHLRGYDVSTDEVQSAILICLLGTAGTNTLKRAGVEIGKKSTAAALRKVPGRVLIEINKKVGYRLVTKAGEKGLINLTKLVPLVGGPIGATVDTLACRAIAGYALSTFEPLDPPTIKAQAVVIDAELVADGEG